MPFLTPSPPRILTSILGQFSGVRSQLPGNPKLTSTRQCRKPTPHSRVVTAYCPPLRLRLIGEGTLRCIVDRTIFVEASWWVSGLGLHVNRRQCFFCSLMPGLGLRC